MNKQKTYWHKLTIPSTLWGQTRPALPDATIFLKDFADYDSMNEVWDKGLPKGYAPCRTCVQAHLAKPEWRLGIKIIAAKI